MPSEIIKEILVVFQQAEQNIKKLERLGEGVIFPAVNQLRYIAYHVLRDSASDKYEEDELREALYHAHRALHDSSEAGISYLLDYIMKFQSDYRTVVISDTLPEYTEICKRSTKANRYLTTRSNNSVKEHANGDNAAMKDVKKAAERFNKYFEALENDVLTLKVNRDELNKKLALRREKVLMALFTIAISSIGLVIATLTYIFIIN